MDAYKNFAVLAVVTAPSPAAWGTSLVVTTGHGARFPAVPFNATVWPNGVLPDPVNAEIVRVTAISTDTFTITRMQESTSARTIIAGDLIAAAMTKKTLDDLVVPSGAMILLASLSASASASLDFTTRNAAGQSGAIFQTDYDHYRIEFMQVVCATMGTSCYFRVSTDGGATWISAANSYFYAGFRYVANITSGVFNDGSFSSTYGTLAGLLHNGGGGGGICGTLDIWRPARSGEVHAWHARMGFSNSSGLIEDDHLRGLSMNTSAANAIRFAMVSGNITSGWIRIYGIAG